MLTKELIMAIAPHARDDYVEGLLGGAEELKAASINTPMRMAMFLTQVCHETGYLTILRENTKWTPDQMCALWPHRFNTLTGRQAIKRCLANVEKEGGEKDVALANLAYSDRLDIGNLGGDDGYAYRGASYLQGTGRAWFKEAGAAVGFPLEEDPYLIEDPAIGLLTALWTWGRRGGLNRFADRGYVVTIGNAINRGDPFSSQDPIGHADRLKCANLVMRVMGLAWPSEDELALGARGDKVERLQQLLQSKGYHLGSADGVFGPETARQVAAAKIDFKRQQGGILEPEEVVGPQTWAALDALQPIEVGAERAMVGLSHKEKVATLIDRGSTEVLAGKRAQQAGTGLATLGLFEGASQLGGLDLVNYYSSQVTALKLTLVPALGALQWVTKNIIFVALICGGVWMWTSGRDVILSRLKAFISRANLSK